MTDLDIAQELLQQASTAVLAARHELATTLGRIADDRAADSVQAEQVWEHRLNAAVADERLRCERLAVAARKQLLSYPLFRSVLEGLESGIRNGGSA